MLKVNTKSPAFTLPDGSGKSVSLTDFRGKTVVLYFYPRDLTPGCTIEAQQFQQYLKAIRATGAEVIGISKDPPERHRKFAEQCALTFPLLSDVDGKVIEAYGVWQKKWLYGKSFLGIARVTYLIGPDGMIEKVFPKVSPKTHAEAVLAALTEAQKQK
ncbi:MAG: thioredoxin-dependent thiol peroxidase [Deltaproteobacteria bacterium]|nr:thioredoxin-dependent thiol peroxidase [Deltaproteobacteria bacterium]